MEGRVVVEDESILSEIQVKLLKLHWFVEFTLSLVGHVDGHLILAAGEVNSSVESVMTSSTSADLYLAIVIVILNTQNAANCRPYFSGRIGPC